MAVKIIQDVSAVSPFKTLLPPEARWWATLTAALALGACGLAGPGEGEHPDGQTERVAPVPAVIGSEAAMSRHLADGQEQRLSARDLAAVNAYESVDSGLYVRRRLPVRCRFRVTYP